MDLVHRTILTNTALDAADTAARSAVLKILPGPQVPPASYLCTLDVPYLCRQSSGTVGIAPGPVVFLISFPQDYLYSPDPYLYQRVAAVLTPDFMHPYVSRNGAVCLGAGFMAGTPFNALIWELYEILCYRNRTVDERNAFSPDACRLIRANESLLKQLHIPPLFQKKSLLNVRVRPVMEGPHGAR